MKISEQWLRQWVNPNNTTEELAEQLTMAGLEIDGIETVAAEFTGVVVGEVMTVEPHPDADKLRVATVKIGVDDNADKYLQIVCGAPNVRVGLKTPVATIGAKLPTADGKGFKIRKSKLRGVESQGMLCGASEIDLVDSIDGLLELSDDAPIGVNIRDYLGLDGRILDVSITPNRGDCFSVRGIAREISVINQLPLTLPEIETQQPPTSPHTADSRAVIVEAASACPRYLIQAISGINREVETPAWMAQHLVQSGQRLHNFLVDVTNFVLLEQGQPLHAFDADAIEGAIQVRLAKAGETVTLLNEQTVTLIGDELVIADDKGLLGLAGIMGAMRGSVTDNTTNIVIESAFFDPLAIAGRARRFGLHTDASQRFERGVDFELPETALARAVNLITKIAGGQLGGITRVEHLDNLPNRAPVVLPIQKVEDVLGIHIGRVRIIEMLKVLDFKVTESSKGGVNDIGSATSTNRDDADTILICTPPSHRFDIAIAEDLIEEVARIYGYDNIPSTLPKLGVDMSYDDTADLIHTLKLSMVDTGYMEAISFSFSDAQMEQVLDDPALGTLLPLMNPISADLAVMRRTLLSSLLPCVQYNLNRQQSRVRFFETGLSFVGATVAELVQTPSMALVATGDVNPEQAYNNRPMDFFDLKHDIEQLLPNTLPANGIRYERSELAFLHPGQSATLFINEVAVGWLGQLHPTVAKTLDLPTTWVAQIALEPILEVTRAEPPITNPSKFPQVRRDIALLVDADIPRQALAQTIETVAGALLQKQWLFDVYQGANMPEGKRSVAFALIWQDATQTLSDEVVNEAMARIVTALQTEHDAVLRDS